MVIPSDTARAVLLVMCGESKIEEYLASRKAVVVRVLSCEAAMYLLTSGAEIGLVITEDELPDGDWRVIVDAIHSAGLNTEVLVRHRYEETTEMEVGRLARRLDLEGSPCAAHGQSAINTRGNVNSNKVALGAS